MDFRMMDDLRDLKKYLYRFENESPESEHTPPEPPSYSSFYWRNDCGQKFKAFVPTGNRDVYYRIEEYDATDDFMHRTKDSWVNANYCLSIALLRNHEADQSLYNLIEQVSEMIGEYEETLFEMNRNVCISRRSRGYVLAKYNVRDIINIDTEVRWSYARYRSRILIDDPYYINAINMVFQHSAARIHKDADHRVKHYVRRRP